MWSLVGTFDLIKEVKYRVSELVHRVEGIRSELKLQRVANRADCRNGK
jgi:hypothetical protein